MAIAEKTPTNRKPYSNSLREHQSELTKKLILQALTEIIAEDKILTFTVKDVAKRAGVSHRSIYRHFPTREALFEALYNSSEELIDRRNIIDIPRNVEEIPLLAEKIFAFFEQYPAVIRSVNVASMTLNMEPSARKKRDQVLHEQLASITSNLRPLLAKRAFAVIRYLLSALAWQTLQDRFGLDSTEAGKAIAWALEVLLEDLKKRNAESKPVSK